MYQKFFCMIGLHIRNWEKTNKIKIVSGPNDCYTNGYIYHFEGKCKCCGHTKYTSQIVK